MVYTLHEWSGKSGVPNKGWGMATNSPAVALGRINTGIKMMTSKQRDGITDLILRRQKEHGKLEFIHGDFDSSIVFDIRRTWVYYINAPGGLRDATHYFREVDRMLVLEPTKCHLQCIPRAHTRSKTLAIARVDKPIEIVADYKFSD